MKKESGITLTSLIIYIIGLMIIMGIVAAIINFFNTSIRSMEGSAENASGFSKFNLMFLEEVKTEGNAVEEIEDNYVLFSTGNKYLFQDGNIYQNKIAIVNDVKTCNFRLKNNEYKQIVSVYIEIGNKNSFAKTIDYVLESEAQALNYTPVDYNSNESTMIPAFTPEVLATTKNSVRVKTNISSNEVKSQISEYKFLINGTVAETQSEEEYTFTGLTPSKKEIQIIATDTQGKTKASNKIEIVNSDIYVSKQGNDTTGNGTISNPYATVSKAITSAVSGNSIYIDEGIYDLDLMASNYTNGAEYGGAGICDSGKQIEILGENSKTVLNIDGTDITQRDVSVLELSNANSIVRNITFVYKPKSGNNYQRSIFRGCIGGTVNNCFFRIIGTNEASYTYSNSQNSSNKTIIKNCTFFHDLNSASSSYTGYADFINIAANVAPTIYLTYPGTNTGGTLTNVRQANFGTSSNTLRELINASKTNATFVENQAGVFYGDYAW